MSDIEHELLCGRLATQPRTGVSVDRGHARTCAVGQCAKADDRFSKLFITMIDSELRKHPDPQIQNLIRDLVSGSALIQLISVRRQAGRYDHLSSLWISEQKRQ